MSSVSLEEMAKEINKQKEAGSAGANVAPTEECKGVITNKIRQRRETCQQEHRATQPRILALNKIDKQKDHIINQQNYIFQSRPAQKPSIDVHADFLNNQKY